MSSGIDETTHAPVDLARTAEAVQESLGRVAALVGPVPRPLAPAGPAPQPEPEPAPPRHRARTALAILAGEPGVALLAVVAGVVAQVVAQRAGIAMDYAAARSHITISRRLFDGPTPGIGQLGTVWLPLPHLLVAPFTAITSWWRSGLAAGPVNVVCLVVESVALFRIVVRAGRSRAAAWYAVLLVLTNPGWLYLHTTALGEPVLLASLLLMVAGLSGWLASPKAYSGGELALFAGIPAAAAVLSRYDGWAMATAATVFVGAGAQLRWKRWRYSLRCARSFAAFPALAGAWWCWYNFVNYGDPLEFQRGKYSAQAQQALLAKAGLLPDQGALGRSVVTYLRVIIGGAGPLVVGAAALGSVVWLVESLRRRERRTTPPWLLLGVPTGFYVMSLYTGQIAIRLGDQAGGSIFNLRYGLQTLPGLAAMAAVGIAALARVPKARIGVVVTSVALVAVSAGSWATRLDAVPIVVEGRQQRSQGAAIWAAAEYLHRHTVGAPRTAGTPGLILIDDSANPVLPLVAADLHRVVAPFSGPRWTRVLHDPALAEWVFVDTAGRVMRFARATRDDPAFAERFEVVFQQATLTVFHNRRPTTNERTAHIDEDAP